VAPSKSADRGSPPALLYRIALCRSAAPVVLAFAAGRATALAHQLTAGVAEG